MGKTGFVLSLALLLLTIAGIMWTVKPESTVLAIFVFAWLVSSYGLLKDNAWGLPITIILLSASTALLIYGVAIFGGLILSSLLLATILAHVTCMSAYEVSDA